MTFRSVFVIGVSFLTGFVTFFAGASQVDDKKMPQIIKRTVDGYSLEFFENSASVSQALAVNAEGSFIGFRETPNEELTIFRQVYFYWGSNGSKDVPLPDGFTNVEAAALSDNNIVVGRTTKPLGAEDGSLRAFCWNVQKSNVELLPRPEGDLSCDAQDITSDGTRITGYVTGPERLRPAVWIKDVKTEQWTVTVLSTVHQMNPYLMSAQLMISPDGKFIAGCCTERFLPDGTVDSSLYAWREVNGKWEQTKLLDEQMYVKAINNKGEIVGSVLGKRGRLPCVVTAEGKLKILELLDGDVSGEARDINNNSEIVGYSDDAHGKEGGTVPCKWTINGKVTQLQISDDDFGVAFGINDVGQIVGAGDVDLKPAPAKNEKTKNDAEEDSEGAMLAVRATKVKK
ncbi:MAG: hypothetical protein U0930_05590 [Pirellulales bacterium]